MVVCNEEAESLMVRMFFQRPRRRRVRCKRAQARIGQGERRGDWSWFQTLRLCRLEQDSLMMDNAGGAEGTGVGEDGMLLLPTHFWATGRRPCRAWSSETPRGRWWTCGTSRNRYCKLQCGLQGQTRPETRTGQGLVRQTGGASFEGLSQCR